MFRFVAAIRVLAFLTAVSVVTLPLWAQDAKGTAEGQEGGQDPAGKRSTVLCELGQANGYWCSNMNLVSFLPKSELGAATGIGLNDAWGWVDPQTGQRWALVGREDGTAFVEITDPESPRYAGELPMPSTAQSNVWRDIKVDGTWAFVVADGSGSRQGMHGMQVFDLTRLRSANGSPETFTADAHYTDFAVAHNVVVNEASDRTYAVGARVDQHGCNSGLHMIDISDPLMPSFLGCFADRGTGHAGTGYTHDAQCVIYEGPDPEHRGREICVGSNETALSVVDVTDADNPRPLSRASYPAATYVHQGWFSEDQRLFIQNDELDERVFDPRTHTYIWDVEDLDDPVLLTDFVSNVTSTDHNLYVRGDLVYQANYSSGLRVLDITDPADPFVAGYFDTRPDDNGVNFNGAWTAWPYPDSDLVIISSRGEGLFVVRPSMVMGVRFSSFRATGSDDQVQLQWSLNRDVTLDTMEIWSLDPDGWFRNVATVDRPAATSQFSLTPGEGIFRYRLEGIAEDGGRIVSGIQSVNTLDGSHILTPVWPNPASSRIQATIGLAESQTVQVRVLDAVGRDMVTLLDAFVPNDRMEILDLDISDLPAGPYFLSVTGSRFSEVRPFIVAR
ncbi:MAG: choice-of-anchor B family protein [Bacteroidetes bacterium]|nr:choice-of-anchor B family protein [Bacteroidota bacterium]